VTIKEQLVEIVKAEGYDFFTACEMVAQAMKELKPGKNVLNIGKAVITVEKRKD